MTVLTWNQWLRHSRQALLDLVFPPRCAGCGRRGDWLCLACARQLRPLAPPWCDRCGAPLSAPGWCAGCRAGGPFALDFARAGYAFAGPLRAAIHRFKYTGERARAAHLAGLVQRALWHELPHPERIAGIVAVPLDAARRQARGYNQAEELVRVLADMTGQIVLPGLVRTRTTRPQVGLDRAARHDNVRGAFSWRGAALSGQAVLLVDDVLTTGATAEACAGALKIAGAAWVGLLAVARPVGYDVTLHAHQ